MVFVIDCDDKQRLALARKELLSLSEQIGQTTTIPFIVAANKQDISSQFARTSIRHHRTVHSLGSMSKEELIHALSVPKITSNEWKVFEMSALSGNTTDCNRIKTKVFFLGGGVMEMFSYLSKVIHDRK